MEDLHDEQFNNFLSSQLLSLPYIPESEDESITAFYNSLFSEQNSSSTTLRNEIEKWDETTSTLGQSNNSTEPLLENSDLPQMTFTIIAGGNTAGKPIQDSQFFMKHFQKFGLHIHTAKDIRISIDTNISTKSELIREKGTLYIYAADIPPIGNMPTVDDYSVEACNCVSNGVLNDKCFKFRKPQFTLVFYPDPRNVAKGRTHNEIWEVNLRVQQILVKQFIVTMKTQQACDKKNK